MVMNRHTIVVTILVLCAAPTNRHSPSAGRRLDVTLVAPRVHSRPVGVMCRMSSERVSPGMTDTLSS
jgi:hypothetical protein